MANLAALVLYISTVLSSVAPHIGETRRASISRDIAVATLSSERAFDDDATGQKTALLLVAIAHYETGKSWATWIDDGRCNDPAWRLRNEQWLKAGGCDNAKAWGMWQVHAPGDDPALGKRYVENRQAGIRAALFIVRESLKMGVGLCAYSGETFPKCRKADHRFDKAREWEVKFPFVVASGAP